LGWTAHRLSIVSGMTAPGISPSTYHRVTLFAVLALAFIIVTGGAVRLTGSGLGCPDWPTCTEGRLVAPMEYHAMVEFVNRAVTGLVSLAVMLAVLGSLLRRPRRRDLTWLSVGLVAGVAGQIVLGGLTVLFELAPPLVMGHFLLSMVLLWNAVVLHHRAGPPFATEAGPPFATEAGPPPSREAVQLGRLAWVAAAIAIFTGTIVTATGPHGGDADVRRLDLFLPDVARLHGISVVILLLLSATTMWMLRREGAGATVRRRGTLLLGVLLAQATIGYVQYFTGVPVVLVGAHIVGAVAVWTAVIRFNLALSRRVVVPADTTADHAAVAPALSSR
jgi:heme a synthase